MARTFRIYDKNKTIVYEGDNPLIISNLTENTAYPAQYTMTALEKGYESDPITIPEFRTYLKQSITVAGVETTGEYKTLDVTQADYLALATKEENTVYRVQPTDSGSGRVHFLGSQIVDLTKDKDGNVVYGRNWVLDTTSVYKLFNNNAGYNRSKRLLPEYLLLQDLTFTAMLDNTNGDENAYTFYEVSGKSSTTGSTINIGASGLSTVTISTAKLQAQITGCDAIIRASKTTGVLVKQRQLSPLINKTYTIAPEDITSSVNSGGGTFG